jgi:hypothetical protein
MKRATLRKEQRKKSGNVRSNNEQHEKSGNARKAVMRKEQHKKNGNLKIATGKEWQ